MEMSCKLFNPAARLVVYPGEPQVNAAEEPPELWASGRPDARLKEEL